MFILTINKIQIFALVLISIFVSGCAGVRVFPITNDTNAANNLKTAHVVWLDKSTRTFIIIRFGQGYKPTISDSDNIEARQSMEPLMLLFQKSGVEKVKARLSQNGVIDGDEVVLELYTSGASFDVDGKRNIDVLASIKKKESAKVVWSVMISSYGPHSVKDEVIFENFISMLVKELKSAGWLK